MMSFMMKVVRSILRELKRISNFFATIFYRHKAAARVNLCAGKQIIPGYTSIDFGGGAEIKLDLSKNNLPLMSSSVKSVVCISAINYLVHRRISCDFLLA